MLQQLLKQMSVILLETIDENELEIERKKKRKTPRESHMLMKTVNQMIKEVNSTVI